MRPGEILKLRWEDVDLKTGYIHVKETKTDEARYVPINDTLALVLREIRKEQGLRSKYVFSYAKSEDNLKGPNPVRKRKKPEPAPEGIESIKTAFNAAVRRSGIKDFKFHDLRHTFASHFVMRGGSLKELQEILGHKTVSMTMRYAHLSQEHKKKAVNLLNGLTALPQKPADCHKMSHFDNHQSSVAG